MSYLDPPIISCQTDHLSFHPNKDFSQEERELVINNIQCIANKISEQQGIPFKQVLHPKGGYGLTMRLPLFTEISYANKNLEVPHVFLKIAPKNESRSFFCCEVKGHPLSSEQWLCVRLWLEEIFSKENYKLFMLKPVVTKLDIAADFNVDIEQMLFDHARSQSGGIFFNRSGAIKTIYIGNMKSTSKICIYCRRTKREQIGMPSDYQQWTRIETRLKLSGTSLFELKAEAKFDHYFSKFSLYDFKKMAKSGIVNNDFLDICRAWGLNTAMQRKSPAARRIIKKEIAKFMIMPIDEGVLLELWYEDLKKLNALKPSFNMNREKVLAVTTKFNDTYF